MRVAFEYLIVVLFVLFFLIVYTFELSFLARFFIGKFIASKNSPVASKVDSGNILIHIFAVLGVIFYLYGYFIEPYNIEIKMVDIKTDKLKKATIRIVHISDLHCESKKKAEDKVVEIINSLLPDIVVFTGDAINTIKGLSIFKDTLNRLNARIGKFGVRGNYEWWFWPDIDLFGETGFTEVKEDSIRLEKDGEGFYLSGINFGNESKFSKVLRQIPGGSLNIFLYHKPELIESIAGFGKVDLFLCGHTHGGQIALPFYGALVTLSRYGKRYESGRYKVGDVILYVNRGIGMAGGIAPRIRIFSRPEITVYNIGPAKKEDAINLN